jgi:hypothetical protein
MPVAAHPETSEGPRAPKEIDTMGALKLDVPVRRPRQACGAAATVAASVTPAVGMTARQRRLLVSMPTARRLRAARALAISVGRAA